MHQTRSIVLLSAILSPLAAQTTWIVDSGGGGNFTDLPPALVAAADGDSILVRPGTYSGGTTNKGLTILGSPRANLQPFASLTVVGLPAGRHFVIKRIDQSNSFAGPPTLRVEQCLGSVHVEDVQVTASFAGGSAPSEGVLSVRSSAQVTVVGSTLIGEIGVACASSTLSITNSVLRARDTGSPGLLAQGSNVVLCEITASGGPGAPLGGPGGPGIQVEGGRVSLRAETASTVAAGGYCLMSCTAAQSAVINLGGSLSIDVLVQLLPWRGAPPVVGSWNQTIDDPALVAAGAAIGGVVPLRLRAEPNAAAAFLISLTADPLPTPFGDLWLNVFANKVIFVGVTDLAGRLQAQWPVTSAVYPRPSGVLVTQAIVLPATGPLELSNPASVILK